MDSKAAELLYRNTRQKLEALQVRHQEGLTVLRETSEYLSDVARRWDVAAAEDKLTSDSKSALRRLHNLLQRIDTIIKREQP